MRSIALLLFLFASSFPLMLDAKGRGAPDRFAALEEIRVWADESRGFGDPSGVDFSLPHIRLYVTYNSPFSGRSGVYSDAYYFNGSEKKWLRIDSNFFEKGGVLSHVYVDLNENDLVYVDFDGKVIKRFPLKDYSYK